VNNLLDVEKEEGLHTAKKVLDSYVCGNEDYKMDGDFLIKTLKPRLTWMDTLDRRGKPIEINAYWQSAIKKYNELSDDKFPFEKNIEHSIEKFFENGKICDILEPENKEDLENNEKRPNFVIALEYLNPPTNVKKRILGHMEKFYTPRGLYSLLPNSFGYQEEYIGNQEKRDFSYHRGIIWPWLMIPYIKVLKKFDENKTDRLDEILGELEIMKNERCVGHISELVEPKTMQQCGCPAQLWSDAILEYLKKLKN
jgi:predicted glycogen debranching enzyme